MRVREGAHPSFRGAEEGGKIRIWHPEGNRPFAFNENRRKKVEKVSEKMKGLGEKCV